MISWSRCKSGQSKSLIVRDGNNFCFQGWMGGVVKAWTRGLSNFWLNELRFMNCWLNRYAFLRFNSFWIIKPRPWLVHFRIHRHFIQRIDDFSISSDDSKQAFLKFIFLWTIDDCWLIILRTGKVISRQFDATFGPISE